MSDTEKVKCSWCGGMLAPQTTEPAAPEVEVWGICHPEIGFRFSGVCVSTDIDDAITWAKVQNICDDTDKWKARKFRLSVNQPVS